MKVKSLMILFYTQVFMELEISSDLKHIT